MVILHQVGITQLKLLHKNVKIVGTIHGIKKLDARRVDMGTMMEYLTVQVVDDTRSMGLLGQMDTVQTVD
jgi:hypothetical protein